MSYLVLARKWRPQTFEDIIGQEHVTHTLQNAIRSNRVAHAFLFTGVRGVGKTTAARILAKALNCEQGPTPTPCNTCTNCLEITAGNAIDVLEIDGASNTGVDDVREIIENVRYRPAKSRFKIYIIDEVHMLSTSAFNALLKTLEEPPAHVKFIFATTDPHKVPHTIHSRCQRYDFKRIPLRLIAERLIAIARSEGVTVSEPAVFQLAREGEGSMRDAQSLLDQVIAFAGKTIRDEDIGAALGLADRKMLSAVADALLERQPARALELLNELHLFGYDLRRFTRELLEHFRNLAVARLLPQQDLLADLTQEERAEVGRQAQQMSVEDLDRAFRILVAAETEVARVPYPKLVLEMTLIKLGTLTPVLPAEELLSRLDQLEQRLSAGVATGDRATAPATAKPSAAATPPASRRPPDPGAAARPSATPTVASDPGTAMIGGRWEEFLTFIGKHKMMLLPYLAASSAPIVEGDHLALTVPPGYYFDYLVQREHMQFVEELAQRFFEMPVHFTVRPAAEPDAATTPAASPAELHAEALGNPLVRAAVDILGGEVQEVKSRARPARGQE